MNWDTWYQIALALCVWREASGEGHDGMRAVAHVVANRVEATHLPDTWDDVIFRKWQFSSMTANGDPSLMRWPISQVRNREFTDAMQVAELVYAGNDPDNTGGATMYYADTIPPPKDWDWAKLKQTVKIGHHTFFKELP